MYTSDPTEEWIQAGGNQTFQEWQLGCAEPQQLGDILSDAESLLGGLFQSSDPVKDRERLARIEQAYSLAIAGNTTTLVGGRTGLDYLQYVAGPNELAWGSDIAHAYAQQRLADYQTYVATHGGTTGGILGGAASSSMLPLIGAGLAVLLLTTSGKRGRH